MFAHINKRAVFSSLLLFATKRLDLRLEVGGPWLTGKHKLGEKLWLAAVLMCEAAFERTCLAPQPSQGFGFRAGIGTAADGIVEYLG